MVLLGVVLQTALEAMAVIEASEMIKTEVVLEAAEEVELSKNPPLIL